MPEATRDEDATPRNPIHLHQLLGEDRRVGSESKDLISALPDEILHHILSLVPTRYAIRTTVLSKRWRSVWPQTPSLSFDSNEFYPDSIDKALALHASAKIRSFDLRLDLSHRLVDSRLDRWIAFAMSRHVEELFFSIQQPPTTTDKYELPQFLFNNSTLVKLSLELFLSEIVQPQGYHVVSWTSLKSLSLRFCVLCDESISRILSGCPMLEFLKLDSCEVLLGKMQNVERLSLGTSALQILSVAELKGLACGLLKCKTLTLETTISNWILPGVARLLPI